ncbi:hypothetical protein ACIQWR_00200 [Streptomyces sp. NPDC098789]|uniref:hypothetical protein n=1 Tax=Streptomyces sp. NPDC098789 TaxID=3366098 RepID=UPI00380AB32F
MSARRPLLTALGATTLLGALWFVPNAGATSATSSTTSSDAAPGAPANANAQAGEGLPDEDGAAASASRSAPESRPQLLLADTGSVDTGPYLIGGTLCLGAGAGFVAFSVRRARAGDTP